MYTTIILVACVCSTHNNNPSPEITKTFCYRYVFVFSLFVFLILDKKLPDNFNNLRQVVTNPLHAREEHRPMHLD